MPFRIHPGGATAATLGGFVFTISRTTGHVVRITDIPSDDGIPGKGFIVEDTITGEVEFCDKGTLFQTEGFWVMDVETPFGTKPEKESRL